ncbi:MAG: radical SAM protein [Lachnospiraceae bacterium]|nr:radical SAM protein [Lachnospiraceae bacterium]
MNSSKNTFYNPPFSRVYIEEEALASPAAADLLRAAAKYSGGQQPIVIRRYMDVFGRAHQSFAVQKNSPALILAVKHGSFLYPGADVCQSFGNSHFYYTSFAMNCPFHCEYCYLQGMYPSANLVLFVNLDDYFAEIERLLAQHPVYLCISYDTDLLALERMTGFVRRYLEFAAGREGLVTELRTKSAFPVRQLIFPPATADGGSDGAVCPGGAASLSAAIPRTILAYTLSPESVVSRYEHGTAPLSARLSALRAAAQAGFPVRLCFDPLLRIPDFDRIYGEFIDEVHSALDDVPILDVGIGVFRISDSYLKQMRKSLPGSALLQYPFENTGHVCHYGARGEKMIAFVKQRLSGWIPEEKIYTPQLPEGRGA